MAVVRPAVALDSRRFGRGPIRRGPILWADAKPLRALSPPSALANDLRLVAVTVAAGFLFVSILIG
jgi:hypothetical protein